MSGNEKSDRQHSQSLENQADGGRPSVDGCLFDPDTFAEFLDLMGPAQAMRWLDEFRDGLMAECATPHDATSSRANIHQICARAGLIGLPALHMACLAFLEAGPGHCVQAAAYQRVCAEAERVFPEIERHRAALG